MKKNATILIFILLTGIFAGVFFGAGLSADNSSYLASRLLAGFAGEGSESGFFADLASALSSNLILIALMLPALATKLLCLLPPAILWFKGFSIGFCSGLIYTNAENATLLSLTKLLPPNLFIIPAFLLIAATLFQCSVKGGIKKSRPRNETKGLLILSVTAFALLLAGCITEAICH